MERASRLEGCLFLPGVASARLGAAIERNRGRRYRSCLLVPLRLLLLAIAAFLAFGHVILLSSFLLAKAHKVQNHEWGSTKLVYSHSDPEILAAIELAFDDVWIILAKRDLAHSHRDTSPALYRESAWRHLVTAGSWLLMIARYAMARLAWPGVSVWGRPPRSATSLHALGMDTRSTPEEGRGNSIRVVATII